jgi:hypothetical protein
VLFEIVVGAVGDPFEFRPAAEREVVFDIHGAFGVVRELVLGVFVAAEVLPFQAEGNVPVPALLKPVLEPLLVRARLDKVLELHLLKLAGAEDKVARCDLVPKALAYLRDPERDLYPARLQHVLEVDEHPLRRLGPEVGDVLRSLDRPRIRLEHQVKGSYRSEIPPAVHRVLYTLVTPYNLRELFGGEALDLHTSCFLD